MQKVFLALLFCAAIRTLNAQPAFIRDSLDAYIKKGMKDWDIPGLSLVIVKDGRVVLMKGYGVKDIESGTAVDENTLFFIASNTKLFTGTALANLAYRHQLSLDDKITKYFPAYRLYDSTATSLVTIRDMLSHRIGTKTFQGDFTFWNSQLSRQEIMQRMRLLKPVGQFRQDYGYCNSCFLTAGEVIPQVAKQSWESYVQDSIVTPVGMKQTHVLSNNMPQFENVALPYTNLYTGKLQRVPFDRWDNLAPAASIASNVNDLSRWLLFQLDSGRVDGKPVLPWPVLRQTRTMNTVLGSRGDGPSHFGGYGLGIFIKDYYGRMVYYHGGGAAGMISNVTFVPEEKLGFAILTNNDNHGFLTPLQTQIIDAFIGRPFANRSEPLLPGFKKEMQAQVAEIEAWKQRAKTTKAPADLNAYAGEYSNELYGKLNITRHGEMLTVRFPGHQDLTATLQYMGQDEWLLTYDNIEYGIFSTKFTQTNGKVASLVTKQNDFVEIDPYTFIKTK